MSGTTGADRILESILDPSTSILVLSCHGLESKNHAHLRIDTGTHALSTWEQSYEASGQTRAYDLPAAKTIEDWIQMLHELMVALDVASAILPLYATATAVLADTMMGSIGGQGAPTSGQATNSRTRTVARTRRTDGAPDCVHRLEVPPTYATRAGEPICAITTSRRSADSTEFGARSILHA